LNRIKDMTKGNPTKLILLFALPLILGNFGQQLYMVVDAIIVGQGVGVEALAALGATDWIYWLVLWTVQAMTQGFSILITQNFGSGNHRQLRKSITMSTLLCLFIGIALTVASLLAAKPLLTLLKTPSNIYEGSLSYITVMYAGTLIVTAYNMASAILRSFGDGKTPLIAMAIAAVTNIGLDLLFVIVFGWGITGAATATLIAQLISFLYCLHIIRKIPIIRTERTDWSIDGPIIKKLCKLGFPLAFQHTVIAIGGMILQSVINGFGFIFVAGFTATNKLYGMLESSAISFGFSTSTYMAQNWGANLVERLEKGLKSAVKLSVIVSVAISAAMLIFGRDLLGMFVPSSSKSASQVLDIAYQYLFIMSVLLVILYLLHTYRSALQGLGNTIAPMISGFIEFAMRVGIAVVLPSVIGEFGIFFAEPAAWAGAAVYLIIAYYREIRLIKQKGITFPLQTSPEKACPPDC